MHQEKWNYAAFTPEVLYPHGELRQLKQRKLPGEVGFRKKHRLVETSGDRIDLNSMQLAEKIQQLVFVDGSSVGDIAENVMREGNRWHRRYRVVNVCIGPHVRPFIPGADIHSKDSSVKDAEHWWRYPQTIAEVVPYSNAASRKMWNALWRMFVPETHRKPLSCDSQQVWSFPDAGDDW